MVAKVAIRVMLFASMELFGALGRVAEFMRMLPVTVALAKLACYSSRPSFLACSLQRNRFR